MGIAGFLPRGAYSEGEGWVAGRGGGWCLADCRRAPAAARRYCDGSCLRGLVTTAAHGAACVESAEE